MQGHKVSVITNPITDYYLSRQSSIQKAIAWIFAQREIGKEDMCAH